MTRFVILAFLNKAATDQGFEVTNDGHATWLMRPGNGTKGSLSLSQNLCSFLTFVYVRWRVVMCDGQQQAGGGHIRMLVLTVHLFPTVCIRITVPWVSRYSPMSASFLVRGECDY